MSIRYEVQLIRVGDSSPVLGFLTALNAKHLEDFRLVWRDKLTTLADEDRYWDWERKQRIYLSAGMGMCEGYAIECEDLTQGMMLLQMKGYRSQIEPTRQLVYVRALATAPWNRVSQPEPQGFRAVGGALLQFSRFRSEELGYGGLVGLHSLPTAEEFYRKMGMIEGGSDPQQEDLTYFEWYRRGVNMPEEIEKDREDIEFDTD